MLSKSTLSLQGLLQLHLNLESLLCQQEITDMYCPINFKLRKIKKKIEKFHITVCVGKICAKIS